MSCAACSARVEKAVSGVKGVSACSVNLLTGSMGVEGSASPDAVIAAVRHAGYDAALKKASKTAAAQTDAAADGQNEKETTALRRRLIASLGFWALLMYVSMGHAMFGWPLPPYFAGNAAAIGLLQLLLTVTVMIINQRFFISGYKSLLRRAPNMDALVALGATAAFVYSTVMLFAVIGAQARGDAQGAMSGLHEFYFESAATILTLITLGKLLESRSKGKTTDALKALMKLSPRTATLLQDGGEVTVPIEQVTKGAVFTVRPGETVPVDGIVLEGDSAVDESALSGESLPIDKASGSMVFAGTLNRSGFLKCEATRVGEDTTLSQIIQMVSDAAATKAPIAKAADKVSGVFVPVVIAIAAVTVIAWLLAGQSAGFALARGISVLVISCPCALGLATPVAIMVGSGMGAKHGILFKTAVALEQTGKAQIVALDKTGTITQGEPRVTDLLPAAGTDETELLSAAYALEAKSEHPLAKAICARAQEDGLTADEVQSFRALPGNGLTATLNGAVLLGGSFRFISSQLQVPSETEAICEQLSAAGKTPLLFARGGVLCGVIAVADTIKEDSPQAIRELRNMGLRVVMLTGDHVRTANAIGEKAGVDDVIADVLPDGKEAVIRSLRQQGEVLMVGDGINDAPALTSADVGIAIGAGADVAIDAADVVLMKNRLTDLAAAIRLSRATLRNIHENLFWAFLYNTIGIPLAAGVWIPLFGWQLNPMFAAAAMSLSSFCVVTNALRLNLFRIYDTKRDHRHLKKKKAAAAPQAGHAEKTLFIKGMMCEHCEARVKAALEAVDGVTAAAVSHTAGTAVVTLSKAVEDGALRKAVTGQGYKVTEISG